MNILFFLTPKSEVIYVNEEDTVGQAMDTMEKYKYSAVPIITRATCCGDSKIRQIWCRND